MVHVMVIVVVVTVLFHIECFVPREMPGGGSPDGTSTPSKITEPTVTAAGTASTVVLVFLSVVENGGRYSGGFGFNMKREGEESNRSGC